VAGYGPVILQYVIALLPYRTRTLIRKVTYGRSGGRISLILCLVRRRRGRTVSESVPVVCSRQTVVMTSYGDAGAPLLQPPARMPTCRPRRTVDCPAGGVVSPSSSSTEPLMDLASPTTPSRPTHRSPRSPSTAAGSVVPAAHSCPSAASDDDSGCALEEYAWVPPGLSALQVCNTDTEILFY